MHTIDFQMQTQRLGKALKGVLWWCRDSFIFTASATIQGFVFIWINSFLFWACFFRPKINLRILRDINYRFTKITKLQTTVDNLLDKYNLVLENDSLNYHEMFPGWLWWWCWFLQTIPYLYKCAPGTSTPPWAVSYLITPRAFHDQSDLQIITFVKGYK